MLRAIVFLVGLAFVSALSSEFISNYTVACKRSSPDFNKCMKNALQNIINDLSKEDTPEEDKLDPWVMPEIPLSFGTAAERMGITIGGETLTGLAHTQIKGFRSNLKNKNKLRVEIDIFNRRLNLEGNYTAVIMGPDSPSMSEGDFNVTITGIRGTLVLKGHVVERDGQEYLSIDRAALKPQVTDLHIDVTNANDPFPELTGIVTSLVNQYWRLVYAEAVQFIEEGLDGIIRSYVQEAFNDVPFDKIVPA
ncbi:circadian clock-controlled protein-like [Cimex lectularius]|uniref:Uncharacterized protein n=1 Tax=Cimex lectularius TaxID=79782 RepID=A0A8I6RJ85_CIMLE|nr:circadian clock-controlled protein-like [Cimex lectularius]